MKKPVLFLLLLLCSGIASAQYIIDYSLFSSDKCNVFANGVEVKYGYGTDFTHTMLHTTVLGKPTFSSIDKGIGLYAFYDANLSTFYGTEYRINFSFKQFYKYKIVITAAGPGGQLRVYPNNGYGGEDASCTGPKPIDVTLNNNLVKINNVASDIFQDYTFTYGTIAGGLPLLNIAHLPVTSGGAGQSIIIRKITIIEDNPDPTFEVLPKIASIPCGATTPQTFTVRNMFNHQGTTGYKWTFPANSGWTYNGAPVPTEIQTTTNTLTLAPVCGVTPLPFQVAVTINGTVKNAIPNTITVSTPAYTINGTAMICSGPETYTLSPGLCNSNVQWSATPTGNVTLAPAGNSVTVTKVASGVVNLTATFTNCAGQQQNISKTLNVGMPVITNLLFTNPNGQDGFLCSNAAGNVLTIETDYNILGAVYDGVIKSWPSMQVIKTMSLMGQGGGMYYDALKPGWYVTTVRPSFLNCASEWYETEFEVKDCSIMGMQQNAAFNVALSPNPAANHINVQINHQTDAMKKESGPMKASLYDFYTNKLVKEWSLPGDATTGNLNVQAVKDGHYILQLKKGHFQESKHLIIQH
ncbi:T9SS type A sorting domain-containing protein [Chitinophaga varians]|uniref:T9SS type A sorting domain-containing protein n=1 Tax=Chitinophaga varians TaxID=2202339 RepID=UPI00165FBF0F|nr:T9SS type A sorting domain-containing protein [Chitinophaga varians]MBC9912821.1 hypothetical protein [Chitinophaga varians]